MALQAAFVQAHTRNIAALLDSLERGRNRRTYTSDELTRNSTSKSACGHSGLAWTSENSTAEHSRT
jgi:hypothetical protein